MASLELKSFWTPSSCCPSALGHAVLGKLLCVLQVLSSSQDTEAKGPHLRPLCARRMHCKWCMALKQPKVCKRMTDITNNYWILCTGHWSKPLKCISTFNSQKTQVKDIFNIIPILQVIKLKQLTQVHTKECQRWDANQGCLFSKHKCGTDETRSPDKIKQQLVPGTIPRVLSILVH